MLRNTFLNQRPMLRVEAKQFVESIVVFFNIYVADGISFLPPLNLTLIASKGFHHAYSPE